MWLDLFEITVLRGVESTTDARTGSFPLQSVRKGPHTSVQLVPGEMKEASKELFRTKGFRAIADVIREQKNFCYLFAQVLLFPLIK